MLSLIVLFTVFLGLVLLLGLSDRWEQRRRRRGGEQYLQANLAQLTAWLEGRGHSLPSVGVVTELVNRVSRREIQSEVKSLPSLLSPSSPLPIPPSLSPSDTHSHFRAPRFTQHSWL